MIGIVNYGVGNLGSILNMFRKIGAQACIASDESAIARADKLVLPGVGHFDNAKSSLQASGLIPVLSRRVQEEGTPVLGICVGMQLMTRASAEGKLPGLAWVSAQTKRFEFSAGDAGLKVPHMGWNSVRLREGESLSFGFEETPRFYFAHSYYVACDDAADTVGQTKYGLEFTSIFRRKNILGMQFHPEKSHRFGLQILRNFAERA